MTSVFQGIDGFRSYSVVFWLLKLTIGQSRFKLSESFCFSSVLGLQSFRKFKNSRLQNCRNCRLLFWLSRLFESSFHPQLRRDEGDANPRWITGKGLTDITKFVEGIILSNGAFNPGMKPLITQSLLKQE
jgi:hypothetical protein